MASIESILSLLSSDQVSSENELQYTGAKQLAFVLGDGDLEVGYTYLGFFTKGIPEEMMSEYEAYQGAENYAAILFEGETETLNSASFTEAQNDQLKLKIDTVLADMASRLASMPVVDGYTHLSAFNALWSNFVLSLRTELGALPVTFKEPISVDFDQMLSIIDTVSNALTLTSQNDQIFVENSLYTQDEMKQLLAADILNFGEVRNLFGSSPILSFEEKQQQLLDVVSYFDDIADAESQAAFVDLSSGLVNGNTGALSIDKAHEFTRLSWTDRKLIEFSDVLDENPNNSLTSYQRVLGEIFLGTVENISSDDLEIFDEYIATTEALFTAEGQELTKAGFISFFYGIDFEGHSSLSLFFINKILQHNSSREKHKKILELSYNDDLINYIRIKFGMTEAQWNGFLSDYKNGYISNYPTEIVDAFDNFLELSQENRLEDPETELLNDIMDSGIPEIPASIYDPTNPTSPIIPTLPIVPVGPPIPGEGVQVPRAVKFELYRLMYNTANNAMNTGSLDGIQAVADMLKLGLVATNPAVGSIASIGIDLFMYFMKDDLKQSFGYTKNFIDGSDGNDTFFVHEVPLPYIEEVAIIMNPYQDRSSIRDYVYGGDLQGELYHDFTEDWSRFTQNVQGKLSERDITKLQNIRFAKLGLENEIVKYNSLTGSPTSEDVEALRIARLEFEAAAKLGSSAYSNAVQVYFDLKKGSTDSGWNDGYDTLDFSGDLEVLSDAETVFLQYLQKLEAALVNAFITLGEKHWKIPRADILTTASSVAISLLPDFSLVKAAFNSGSIEVTVDAEDGLSIDSYEGRSFWFYDAMEVASIERIVGSDYDDTFNVRAKTTYIEGSSGNDTFNVEIDNSFRHTYTEMVDSKLLGGSGNDLFSIDFGSKFYEFFTIDPFLWEMSGGADDDRLIIRNISIQDFLNENQGHSWNFSFSGEKLALSFNNSHDDLTSLFFDDFENIGISSDILPIVRDQSGWYVGSEAYKFLKIDPDSTFTINISKDSIWGFIAEFDLPLEKIEFVGRPHSMVSDLLTVFHGQTSSFLDLSEWVFYKKITNVEGPADASWLGGIGISEGNAHKVVFADQKKFEFTVSRLDVMASDVHIISSSKILNLATTSTFNLYLLEEQEDVSTEAKYTSNITIEERNEEIEAYAVLFNEDANGIAQTVHGAAITVQSDGEINYTSVSSEDKFSGRLLGIDILRATNKSDVLFYDTSLNGLAETIQIDLAGGTDWVSFENMSEAIDQTTQSINLDGMVSISDYEGFIGTSGDDKLIALGAYYPIIGGIGVYAIAGAGGDDVLYGSDGRQILFGDGIDFDLLTDFEGGETVSEALDSGSGSGDDFFYGSDGNDWLIGGSGTDTVCYTDGWFHRLKVTLEDQAPGSALTYKFLSGELLRDMSDSLFGIENVIGSGSGDLLTGNSQKNVLDGAGGFDKIQGNGGADILSGNSGNDVLEGGSGADIFVLTEGDDWDIITDFEETDQLLFRNVRTDLTDGTPLEGMSLEEAQATGFVKSVKEKIYSGQMCTIIHYGDGNVAIIRSVDSNEEPPIWEPRIPDLRVRPISPLVLDLDGDGIELVSVYDSQARFDLDGDGDRELAGWVTGGDGLLALDRNQNGVIDDITELFGDAVTDGFTQLSVLDTNNDGIISNLDADFSNLLIWRDDNEDGISDASELFSIDHFNIASINLNAELVDEENQGNLVTHRSYFTLTTGETNLIEDIWFLAVGDSDPVDPITPEPVTGELVFAAYLLPNIAGYGHRGSLFDAMEFDQSLVDSVKNVMNIAWTSNLQEFYAAFEEMVFEWTGFDEIDPEARGGLFDARKLAFMEDQAGIQYYKSSGIDERDLGRLNGLYDAMMNSMALRFLTQISTSTELLPEEEGVSYIEDAEVISFAGLNYVMGADRLSGDFVSTLSDIILSYTSTKNSLWEVKLLFSLLQHDFNDAMKAGAETSLLNIGGFTSFSELFDSLDLSAIWTENDEYILSQLASGNYTMGSGNGSENVLIGSSSDDILVGGSGSDHYIWGRGMGNDTLHDQGIDYTVETDVLYLYGLNAEDIEAYRPSDAPMDLIITIKDTGETLRLINKYYRSYETVEYIRFSDGSLLRDAFTPYIEGTEADEVFNGGFSADYMRGNGGDDTLNGFDNNDTLDGGAGNDVLYGHAGQDTLIGGAGDDYLRGGDDSDRYYWGAGDGNDTINEASGTDWSEASDALYLDLNYDDVSISVAWDNLNDVVIQNKVTGETVTILNQFTGRSWNILERFIFNDQEFNGINAQVTIVGSEGDDIFTLSGAAKVSGLVGNDQITGSAGADIFLGAVGDGDDYYAGRDGSDTYYWGSGYGNDTINEASSTNWSEARDVLYLDLNYEDVRIYVEHTNLADILIENIQTGEILTLKGQHYGNSMNIIEEFVFKDQTFSGLNAQTRISLDGGDYSFTSPISRRVDLIDMGTGNDYVNGRTGGDSFFFNIGDGYDIIADVGYSAYSSPYDRDQLFFEDLSPEDILVSKLHGNSNDAVFILKATGERVHIVKQFYNSRNSMEYIAAVKDGVYHNISPNKNTLYDYTGTNYDDVITDGSGLANEQYGYLGNDTINGGYGNDNYYWYKGHGNDILNDVGHSHETDTLILGDVDQTDIYLTWDSENANDLLLTVLSTNEVLRIVNFALGNQSSLEKIKFSDGSIFDIADLIAPTQIDGTDENDLLVGTTYADGINALGGDDLIYASEGHDTLDGGQGLDTVDYSALSAAITADMEAKTVQKGTSGTDQLHQIEKIIATAFNDTLTGDGHDNYLMGGSGDDLLTGGSGSDCFIFESGFGNDIITDFKAQSSPADIIELRGLNLSAFEDVLAIASDDGVDTTLQVDGQNSIVLKNVLTEDLDQNDFIFS